MKNIFMCKLKRALFVAVLCAVYFVLIPAFCLADQTAEQRLEEGHIIKSISMPRDQEYAYVNVKVLVDASTARVWDLLVDIWRWPMWLPMNRMAGLLSPKAASFVDKSVAGSKDETLRLASQYPIDRSQSHDPNSWRNMAYEYYDLPWPIKNEWMVRWYSYKVDGDVHKASWRGFSAPDGRDDGFWEVRPWKDSRALLHYYYRVRASKNVPPVAFKAAISLTVNQMIRALKKEAMKGGSGQSLPAAKQEDLAPKGAEAM